MHLTYQVQTGSTSKILHHNPQLDAPHKTCLVLRHVGTVARAEQRDLLLYVADVIIAAFKIDVLDGDDLAGCLVPSLVHDTKAAACAY